MHGSGRVKFDSMQKPFFIFSIKYLIWLRLEGFSLNHAVWQTCSLKSRSKRRLRQIIIHLHCLKVKKLVKCKNVQKRLLKSSDSTKLLEHVFKCICWSTRITCFRKPMMFVSVELKLSSQKNSSSNLAPLFSPFKQLSLKVKIIPECFSCNFLFSQKI